MLREENTITLYSSEKEKKPIEIKTFSLHATMSMLKCLPKN